MATTYRIGHGDQAGPVGKDSLHLDLGHDVGHTGQNVIGSDHPASDLERLSDPESVAGRLGHGIGHYGDGLGHVEPQTPVATRASQHCRQVQQQPVCLGRGEVHAQPSVMTEAGCC